MSIRSQNYGDTGENYNNHFKIFSKNSIFTKYGWFVVHGNFVYACFLHKAGADDERWAQVYTKAEFYREDDRYHRDPDEDPDEHDTWDDETCYGVRGWSFPTMQVGRYGKSFCVRSCYYSDDPLFLTFDDLPEFLQDWFSMPADQIPL